MKKITGDTIFAAIFAVIAVIMLFLTNTTLSSKAPAGDPGTRVFPILVCVFILILSVLVIVNSVIHPIRAFDGLLSDPERKQSAMRALLVFMDLGLFLLIWTTFHVPFLIAGFAFLFVQCMIFREKLLFSVIYSAAVTGVLYLMFSKFLLVRLNL